MTSSKEGSNMPAPQDADAVWGEFMSKPRDSHDLISLVWDHSLHPEYRRRSVQALLSPDHSKLPFEVKITENPLETVSKTTFRDLARGAEHGSDICSLCR